MIFFEAGHFLWWLLPFLGIGVIAYGTREMLKAAAEPLERNQEEHAA